jgi:riboflavin synthase
MFTGLIEHVGVVRRLSPPSGGAARLSVDLGPLAGDARRGDSVSINGCCLTISELEGAIAVFDAVPETLRRTNLGELRAGDRVNLERALQPGQRLGGHFVQGHVDGTATLRAVSRGEAWAEYSFQLDDAGLIPFLVEKGSVAVDGVSLTVAGCDGTGLFRVALIPETLARTTMGEKQTGSRVNVETDILGKYVLAFLQRKAEPPAPSRITEERLRELGY